MTNREREIKTLGFDKPDRGAVEETFFPWDLTVNRFRAEGIPEDICRKAVYLDAPDEADAARKRLDTYFPVAWGEGIMQYERYMGFDPVYRVHFVLPFRRVEEKIVADTEKYVIKQNQFGKQTIQTKGSDLERPYRQVVTCREDWDALKKLGDDALERYFSDEAIDQAYGFLRDGHERGDYAIRLHLEGFFWIQRELFGDAEHMMMFYDDPDLLHEISEYMARVYETKLLRVIRLLQPDVLYMMEDLSGKNGPMISGAFFDEFVGAYYRRVIPKFKESGAKYVFVDTDGDFQLLIPNFIAAGVDGFLPMDVNAGMDIVAVREKFPTLRFIGGYNKLCIAQGKAAIDAEFARILPVVRDGGYIVGADHQVPPSASLENYQYYIMRLKDVMAQAGSARADMRDA